MKNSKKKFLFILYFLLVIFTLNISIFYIITKNYKTFINLDKVYKNINLKNSNYSINNLDLINFIYKDRNLIFSPIDLIREKSKHSSLINNNLISYSNKSNSRALEICEKNNPSYYELDQYGFRNKLITPQMADIVVLGDSYTFGACNNQSLTDFLKKKDNFNKYYNLSAHGNEILILKNSLIHFLKFFGKKKFVFILTESSFYYTNLHNKDSIFYKDNFSNSFFDKKTKSKIDKFISNDMNAELKKRKNHFKNYHKLNLKKILNLFYIREMISYFKFNNLEKKKLENIKRYNIINFNNNTLKNNIKILHDLIMISRDDISIDIIVFKSLNDLLLNDQSTKNLIHELQNYYNQYSNSISNFYHINEKDFYSENMYIYNEGHLNNNGLKKISDEILKNIND